MSSKQDSVKLTPLISSSCFLPVVLALAPLILATPTPAPAHDLETKTYQIEAQPISTALKAFAAQSGMQLIYTESDVGQATTPGIKGNLPPKKALAEILRGTDLQYEFTANDVIVVRKPEHTKLTQLISSSSSSLHLAQNSQADTPSSPQSSEAASQSTEGAAADDKNNASNPSKESKKLLEEVVVTAQKKLQRTLDVPLSVTAVQASSLIEQNLVQLTDYYSRVPSLSYIGPNLNALSLRGITTGKTNASIAVTIDDAPFGSVYAFGQTPFPDLDPGDLQRIEVLRGPQGTLYGASSLGGLLKYVTKEPDTKEVSGRVEIGANEIVHGSSGRSIRGSVNIPIQKDRIALSVSGFYRNDPAYVDFLDQTTQRLTQDTNQTIARGGRAALLLRPTDTLTINLSALGQHTTTSGSQNVQVTSATDFTPAFGDLSNNRTAASTQKTIEFYQARINWSLASTELVSISSWGKSDFNDAGRDYTNLLPFLLSNLGPGFPIPTPIYPAAPAGSIARLLSGALTDRFTQEIRWRSTAGHGPIEWLTALYYTKETTDSSQILNIENPAGGLIAPSASFGAPLVYKDRAVFGDLTYHFDDRFDIQAGIRYGRNHQEAGESAQVDAPAQSVFGPSHTLNFKSSENTTTWLVAPSYHISPDLMTYLRIATGYRPGGPNTTVAGAPASYDADTVTNYELGLKGYLFDRSVMIDTAVFQINWDDIQLTNVTAGGISYFANGGAARSRGVEAALQFKPWKNMVVDANATLTDAILTEDVPVPPGVDGLNGADGDRLPYAARFSGNLAAEQSWNLGGGLTGFSAFVGASLSHVGKRPALFLQTNGSGPRIMLPQYNVVDLRTGVRNVDWSINLYIRNVADERGIITGENGQGAPGVPTTVTYIQPRTYGLSIARSF